jgi:hypothetical protein
MELTLNTFFAILFIFTFTMTLYSPCSALMMLVGLIIAFAAIFITNPSILSKKVSDIEQPIEIEEQYNRDRLETKRLDRLNLELSKKEIDVPLENKIFKEEYPELDNGSGVNAILSRNGTDTPNNFDGDEKLANKMAHVSIKNRNAIHNRTRYSSDNFRKYFQEELDENEHRVWWENDILEDMV